MAIYVFTGKLGSGKTLCAVGRIQDYLMQNRRVACNIDLQLQNLIGYQSKKCRVIRIPDRPILDDLESIGLGYDGKYQSEERNGLIVLDECAQYLNTRSFQDKERKKLIDWFVHARKKRWDVIFIIQHLNALDKQFRDMFAEHIVYCNRTDRLRFPFGVRHVFQMLGFSGNLPKVHRALVMYGQGPNAMKVDSWLYTGKSLYNAFATEQGFSTENEGGIFSYIPPYYTHGKYINEWQYYKDKFKTIKDSIHMQMRHFFLCGLLSGIFGTSIATNSDEQVPAQKSAIEKKQQEEKEPDRIYIVGSIIGDYTEFFIEKNGQSFNPKNHGYKILVRNRCHVTLIKDKQMSDVFCGTADTRQRGTEPQNASTVNQVIQEVSS